MLVRSVVVYERHCGTQGQKMLLTWSERTNHKTPLVWYLNLQLVYGCLFQQHYLPRKLVEY